MGLHSSSGRWRLGLALSLVTAFLWGILPIALEITLQGLDVYTVTWFRFSIAFGILGLYLAARQQLPPRAKLRVTSWKLLAVATVFLAINYLFYLQGLAQTSPANAQVLIQLAPVLMGVGAIVIFKERYTLQQWMGVGVLSAGFVLFFHEQLKMAIVNASTYLLGNLILVIAAATWAVYALAQKQLLQQLPSSNIMLLIYGVCSGLFAPLASPHLLGNLTPLQGATLLFCALNTVVAYGAFAEALEHWDASRVSAILATTPIVTLVGVTLMGQFLPRLIEAEHLTYGAIIGALLVVSGSMSIALGRKGV
jgi:drug/metabolite transporter (DMT)-like permease